MAKVGLVPQGGHKVESSIILASQSPRRKELLSKITPNFTVEVSEVDETIPEYMEKREVAAFLSTKKAQVISLRHPEDIVIGCDTIVLVDNEILGKPKDSMDAHRMLQLLSGRFHEVITGTTIFFPDGEKRTFSVSTTVEFSLMSHSEIDAYVATGEPFDKAGAYGIQGEAAKYIQRIDGDYYSVMGFPVAAVYEQLKEYLC